MRCARATAPRSRTWRSGSTRRCPRGRSATRPASGSRATRRRWSVADYLPPTAESDEKHRPYFEVLSVTATDPSRYEHARQEVRRLRRTDDPFVYELVQVGCFEEAVVAVLANPELQAIVIGDGFGFRAERDYPEIRETLDRAIPFDPGAAPTCATTA